MIKKIKKNASRARLRRLRIPGKPTDRPISHVTDCLAYTVLRSFYDVYSETIVRLFFFFIFFFATSPLKYAL